MPSCPATYLLHNEVPGLQSQEDLLCTRRDKSSPKGQAAVALAQRHCAVHFWSIGGAEVENRLIGKEPVRELVCGMKYADKSSLDSQRTNDCLHGQHVNNVTTHALDRGDAVS